MPFYIVRNVDDWLIFTVFFSSIYGRETREIRVQFPLL